MNGQRPLLVSNDPELIRGDPPSDRRRGGPEPLAAGPLGPRRSRLQPSRRLFPAYAPTRRHPHLTGAFGRYLAERGAGCRARCGPAPGRALAHRSPGRDQRGPARNGRLLAVVGAGASAGASTFAVTLALAAARSGKALLVVPTHWAADSTSCSGSRTNRNPLVGPRRYPRTAGSPVPRAGTAEDRRPSGALRGRSGPQSLAIEAASAVLDSAQRAFAAAQSDSDPCAAASRVANESTLVACAMDGLDVVVQVSRPAPDLVRRLFALLGTSPRDVVGAARAGPPLTEEGGPA
jgi:hypothetical protein